MTFEQAPDDDWMRVAVQRSQELHTPSPVPLDQILTAGHARRRQRNTTLMATVAAVMVIVGVSFSLSWSNLFSAPGQIAPAASPPRQSNQVDATVAHGVVDGLSWSVTLEFYKTLPNGYVVPSKLLKGSADKSSLVCQRMMIGGVLVDHQGGRWADCSLVAGAHDPSRAGGAGLWSLQGKGTSGSRLFVANVPAGVAYGVVNLSDGTHLKAPATTVPGTSYRAFAAAIAKGKTITSVDTYNSRHHLLTHDTNWN